MDKDLEQCLLFDFYDELLTEKQRRIFRLYYHEDLSLGEIAELVGISRQGVYDILKRAKTQLVELEGKLKLAKRHRRNQRLKERMLSNLEQLTEALHAQEDSLSKDLLYTVDGTLQQLTRDIQLVDAE
ncbi:MAG: putative DNA-binding protein [Limnochordia bacterium]|nr:putative DNA-binding protein [Limnochordia bacterium]MDD2628664.1 putative DNA-binding protein [Limnochordia bacterium]MDD4516897.1 putative DNA-binding protein [Limnochordia bacterium]